MIKFKRMELKGKMDKQKNAPVGVVSSDQEQRNESGTAPVTEVDAQVQVERNGSSSSSQPIAASEVKKKSKHKVNTKQ